MEEKTTSPSHSPFSLRLSNCKASFRSKKSSSEAPLASPDVWGVPLVSRAYDQDFPYAPVDPFKPSLLYSIRHIFPETPPAVDINSGAECDRNPSTTTNHSHAHQYRISRADNPVTRSNTILEYPFSPLHPSLSTTRPLSIARKKRLSYTADGHYSEYIGSPKNSHETHRYSRPYPSPSYGSQFTGFSDIHSPRQRDFSMPSPQLFPIPEPSPRSPLSQVTPAQHTLVSENAAGPPTPGNSQEGSEGHMLTIMPSTHYLERIPQLEKPPGPRIKRQQGIPARNSVAKSSHSSSHRHSGKEQSVTKMFSTKRYIVAFLIDTLPRQIYLYFLLCLPYMYFSRVAHLFEEAEISLPKIKQAVIEASRKAHEQNGIITHNWKLGPPAPNAAYLNLQKTWEFFIDSLMREWRTLNIVSVLLLSAILSILQIEMAVNDPVTVYTALLSMLCALMSLLYGCVYIIRFGSMRKVTKAAMWAAEAQRSTTCILWNVWVFLAMPATWLAWSMVLYLVCIMSLVWRTGSSDDPKSWNLTSTQALFPRTTVTVVMGLGIIYFGLIVNTLRRYGNAMDRAWHKLATGWVSNKSPGTPDIRRSVLEREARFHSSPSLPRGLCTNNFSPESSNSSNAKSRNGHSFV